MSEAVAVVIGGAGFLGRRLVELLDAGGQAGWPRFSRIRVLDVAPFRPLSASRGPIEAWRVDVRAPAELRRALEGAHTVFHCASMVDVALRPSPEIARVNVDGTRNVVEAARSAKARCLVYTSSEDVVLSEVPVRGGDESLPYPTRPIHPYVATKIAGEKIALAADDPTGMRTISVRPVHVYGPHDPHAIPTSLRAFAKGTVPFLLGDGSARFDVVYVDNVVHGHLLAAAALADPARAAAVAGRAYFLNEDHAPNYFDWLRPYAEARGVTMPRLRLGRRRTRVLTSAMELVGRASGIDVPLHRFHAFVIGEDFFFSGARARRELGYTPIVTKADAQARTEAWVKTLPL